MRPLTGLLLVLFGCTALAGSQSGEPVPACAVDRGAPSLEGESEQLVWAAARVIESKGHINKLWPGFQPIRTGFALLGDTIAVAATRGPPNAPFRAAQHCHEDWVISIAPRQEIKRQGAWFVDVGGGRLLPTGTRLQSVGHDWPFQAVAELIHEQFHSYQDRTFGATPAGSALAAAELVTTETKSPAFQALWAAERALLLNALEDSTTEANVALCRIAAIRARRANRTLSSTQAVAHEERKEGTAHWVGRRAADLALNTDPMHRLLLRDDLRRVRQQGSYLERDAFRSSLYATGASVALLLESPNHAWRDQVQHGATFDDVLSQAVPAHCLGKAEATLALEEAEYPRLLREAEQKASLFANPFADPTAPRLIITGIRQLSSRTIGNEIDVSRTESYFTSPQLIEFTTTDGVVRIEGHTTRLELMPRSITVTVLLDDAMLEQLATQSSAVPLRVALPGLTIEHAAGAVMTRSPGAVLLALNPGK